jgi:hypothetical protein
LKNGVYGDLGRILDDQRRECILILRYVETIMPCALCRNHYREYRMMNPIDKLPIIIPAGLRAARKWLFDLHESVNERNKLVRVLTVDMLPEKYSSLDLLMKNPRSYMFYSIRRFVFVRLKQVYKKFKTHYALFLRYCR